MNKVHALKKYLVIKMTKFQSSVNSMIELIYIRNSNVYRMMQFKVNN